MSYAVRTSTFEGPFDLLLHLVLRQEVDIWEVSLRDLVNEYIDVIERMDHVDLEVATEFLLIAATLVELKARRLLPGTESIELDEELLRFEERDLLLARLLECKTFQDAAAMLADQIRRGEASLARRAGPEEPFADLAPDPLGNTSLKAFTAAARRALAPREDLALSMHHVAPIRVSVSDAVSAVLLRLPDHGSISFRELVTGIDDRIEVIVRFLACLELYKQGHVELEQIDNFGELEISRCDDPPDPVIDSVSLAEWGDEPDTPEVNAPEPAGPVEPDTAPVAHGEVRV